MNKRDRIGARGEHISYLKLTEPCPNRPEGFFKPVFLGEKFETLDFMVELLDVGEHACYFFLQVRSTREGYTVKDRRLKIKVSAKEMQQLVRYQAPTYLLSENETAEKAFIISVNEGGPVKISS